MEIHETGEKAPVEGGKEQSKGVVPFEDCFFGEAVDWDATAAHILWRGEEAAAPRAVDAVGVKSLVVCHFEDFCLMQTN
jgi:hypothetical protein